MGLECLVREHAMIANGRAKPAQCCKEHGHSQNLKAWDWKENQADDGKNMNENQVSENAFFAVNRLPKRPLPRMRLWRLLRQANFHVFSDDLQKLKALVPWPAARMDVKQNNIVRVAVLGNCKKGLWKW